jgi:hypothetical protein
MRVDQIPDEFGLLIANPLHFDLPVRITLHDQYIRAQRCPIYKATKQQSLLENLAAPTLPRRWRPARGVCTPRPHPALLCPRKTHRLPHLCFAGGVRDYGIWWTDQLQRQGSSAARRARRPPARPVF